MYIYAKTTTTAQPGLISLGRRHPSPGYKAGSCILIVDESGYFFDILQVAFEKGMHISVPCYRFDGRLSPAEVNRDERISDSQRLSHHAGQSWHRWPRANLAMRQRSHSMRTLVEGLVGGTGVRPHISSRPRQARLCVPAQSSSLQD